MLCISCTQPLGELDIATSQWLDGEEAPPETTAQDRVNRSKADVIVLPAVGFTVWTVGVLAAYVSGVMIYLSNSNDFGAILGGAVAQDYDWDDIDWREESTLQADILSTSLDEVVYRSPTSDFYAYTGNDYLHFLNLTAQIRFLNPKDFKDMLDGKVRPWAGYVRGYVDALRSLSIKARHNYDNGEFCVKAEVRTIDGNLPYMGLAKAHNQATIIPAAILASLKATTRCGMWDADVRETIEGYFKVSDVYSGFVDTFLSHTMKTAKLLFKYTDACQLPPTISIAPAENNCIDALFEPVAPVSP